MLGIARLLSICRGWPVERGTNSVINNIVNWEYDLSAFLFMLISGCCGNSLSDIKNRNAEGPVKCMLTSSSNFKTLHCKYDLYHAYHGGPTYCWNSFIYLKSIDKNHAFIHPVRIFLYRIRVARSKKQRKKATQFFSTAPSTHPSPSYPSTHLLNHRFQDCSCSKLAI